MRITEGKLQWALGKQCSRSRTRRSLEQDLWDLAVELPELRQARMTHSDLRWLACKGYVEYANETTTPDDIGRQFQASAPLVFTASTCFVLTDAGLAVMRESTARPVEVPAASRHVSIVMPQEVNLATVVPKWDSLRRQLRVDRAIVKEFKLPSPNQEVILMAFEEECWSARIDDPLPPSPDIEPRRRLHDTIKALNRNQKQNLIRFMGDGSGEGIRWEPMHPADAAMRAHAAD